MNLKKIKNAKTKVLGKEVIYYEQINSTQEKAKKMICENIENGSLIIADSQTNGIGTKGRNWYSGDYKNILMTMVIYPNCNIQNLNGLTMQIAKSMKDTIKELYDIQINIKEPNDLMLRDKKIAGILTQSATYKELAKYILIGIGFNVNEVDFSEETKNIATSLKKEYLRDFEREEIIVRFIEKFEKYLIKNNIL